VQPDAHDRNCLAGESGLEIDGQIMSGRVYDDPLDQIPGAGCSQEGVDRRFRDGFSFSVKLALDSRQAIAACKFGNQVDAGVGGVLAAFPGPFGEMPDAAVLDALLRVARQEGNAELFKSGACGSGPRIIAGSHLAAPIIKYRNDVLRLFCQGAGLPRISARGAFLARFRPGC